MKKLINDPIEVTNEMVEGFVAAYPNTVKKIDGHNVVVRTEAPIEGKVGIVSGGGSGHEPFWLGYTGIGFIDATVVGNIFSSPTPPSIYEATKAVDGGKGVLYVLGNYAGDKMNFNIAAEMARAEGIRVEMTQVTDDIASAPKGSEDKRRGIAGNIFALKIAGAKAEEKASFDEVKTVVEKVNSNLRTMGLAISPCTIPAAGTPHFTLEDDEFELGMGIHGEPGIRRMKMKTANEIVEMMATRMLDDLPYRSGDEVAILVNGLGATPLLELLIIFRKFKDILKSSDISIYRSYIGNYVTSLEMAGMSLTLLRLDNELKYLLNAPANTPFFFTP